MQRITVDSSDPRVPGVVAWVLGCIDAREPVHEENLEIMCGAEADQILDQQDGAIGYVAYDDGAETQLVWIRTGLKLHQLRHVVAHELAHVTNGDTRGQAVARKRVEARRQRGERIVRPSKEQIHSFSQENERFQEETLARLGFRWVKRAEGYHFEHRPGTPAVWRTILIKEVADGRY